MDLVVADRNYVIMLFIEVWIRIFGLNLSDLFVNVNGFRIDLFTTKTFDEGIVISEYFVLQLL